jgi:hypothetical protein
MGKLILPKLGGTPQVWNTCMVFFQSVLLAGYAYTHTSGTRLKLHTALTVHCILLALALPLFLIIPTSYWYIQGWEPNIEIPPVIATLTGLLLSIGIPFFVISTSAPLLQKWFAYTGDPAAKDPYFLYGASNLGSLLSLLLYPVLIEPWLPVLGQRWLLLGFYLVLAVLIVACAMRVWKSPVMETPLAGVTAAPLEAPVPTPAPAPEVPVATAVKAGPTPARGAARRKGGRSHLPHETSAAPAEAAIATAPAAEMNNWRRVRWTMLAAVPSSLMLGVTSYCSVDLSPFPLLWIIPLALYLLSFILVYMPWWTGTTAGHRGELTEAEFSPHRLIIYFLMPLSIIALAVMLLRGGFDPLTSTFFLMLSFFGVALGCHGELARERPSTHYLTEYYLLMSFGGMLGGVFNGLLAPVLFTGVWEFPMAIVLACLVRPKLNEAGWTDELILNSSPSFQTWVRQRGDEMAKSAGRQATHSTYAFSYFMDIALGLTVFALSCFLTWYMSYENMNKIARFLGLRGLGSLLRPLLIFGVPLVCCFFFYGRPLRFAIALSGVLLCNQYLFETRSDRHPLYAGRSYFGVLRVLEDEERYAELTAEGPTLNRDEEEVQRLGQGPYPYTYLMHGTTYHGRNYIAEKGKPDASRVATTYYHRYGPVGIVMEQYNWFPGPQNTYWGDIRMPATQVGLAATNIGVNSFLPLSNLVDLWSEPPYATIGLGTGTMASYARPYQNLAYYEIDEKIRNMSLPPEGRDTLFTYLQGAMKRGAGLEVIMGDARLTMQRDILNKDNSILPEFGGAEKNPIVQLRTSPIFQGREKFYKVIVVDAFSSDAIPVHLITREAIELYLSKLSEDGVLCVHTSNRHLDLVKPVARIIDALNREASKANQPGYRVRVGKDSGFTGTRKVNDETYYVRSMGLFGSEYVMIYSDTNDKFNEYLENFKDKANQYIRRSAVRWEDPLAAGKMSSSVWTDDYSNLVSVIRWHWPWSR